MEVQSADITAIEAGEEENPFLRELRVKVIVYTFLLPDLPPAKEKKEVEKPIETKLHGDSHAHFFWIMIAHDLSHAAQTRSIRRAYGSRKGFYPI